MPPPADLDRLFHQFAQSRDPDVLAAVFERSAPWLVARARRLCPDAMQAEDAVQDLFLSLLEKGHGCDPRRDARGYLGGMVRRRADQLRRRQARSLCDVLREIACEDGDPAALAVRAEERRAVHAAIDALPERHRRVLRLHLAQWRPAAIAAALRCSPNSARVQLHRALRRLRPLLPPAVLLLLANGAPAAPLPAARSVRATAAAAGLAIAALLAVLGALGATSRARPIVVSVAALPHAAAHAAPAHAADEGVQGATQRTAAAVAAAAAAVGTLELCLRWPDGSPAAAVGVVVRRAGREADFGGVRAVSDADGVARCRDVSPGALVATFDRGHEETFAFAGGTLRREVALPGGVDVAGEVVDADGVAVPFAEVWVSREPRQPWECGPVAAADADGRFALRALHPQSVVGARSGDAVPSRLHRVGPEPRGLHLVLGGPGARLHGVVRDAGGAPVAGAVVRVAKHPRANFVLPQGDRLGELLPCAISRTDAAGAFAFDGLPAGAQQVLVRSPDHRAELATVDLVAGADRAIELRLAAGRRVRGTVVGPDGRGIAGADVVAHGLVRQEWSGVFTGPDGGFELACLNPERVVLEVGAAGFADRALEVAGDAVCVALQPLRERRVRLATHDGEPATGWDLAHASAGRPEPLCQDDDGAFATVADAPLLARRRGSEVWQRVEPDAADDGRVLLPPDAARDGVLLVTLAGADAAQRADAVLVIERDGQGYVVEPDDAAAAVLRFGPLPFGGYRACVFGRAGRLPGVDLGTVTVGAAATFVQAVLPPSGWLVYDVRAWDGGAVPQWYAYVADEHGFQVPLRGARGRVALAAGRWRLWAASTSFMTVRGQEIVVEPGRDALLDLRLQPGEVRHLAFRLPDGVDAAGCRATIHAGAGPVLGGELDVGDRGFDSTADGVCCTALVLAEGRYRLEVATAAGAVLRGAFVVAAGDGIREPIEVPLAAAR